MSRPAKKNWNNKTMKYELAEPAVPGAPGVPGVPAEPSFEKLGTSDDDFRKALNESMNRVMEPVRAASNQPKWKYAEDQILEEMAEYLATTYGEHYNQGGDNVQCFDAWLSRGNATDTFVNTSMKYLWRYGKKNGNNKKDLQKAMHYIMLAWYADHIKKG